MKVKIGKYPTHRWYHNALYKWFGYSPEQTVKVRIDSWDTWSMDETLAPIILPMLKQLKETKHGAPWTAVEDVPTHLRPTAEEVLEYTKDATTDEHFFERWDWVLDEMIHAFEQKCTDDWVEQDVEEQKRISNGFRLFGKYYENLWD
jgi:hypothetical protein